MKRMIVSLLLCVCSLWAQLAQSEELHDANFFVYPVDMSDNFHISQEFNLPRESGWCRGCDLCTSELSCHQAGLVWYWGHTGLDLSNRSSGATVRAVSWGQVVHI